MRVITTTALCAMALATVARTDAQGQYRYHRYDRYDRQVTLTGVVRNPGVSFSMTTNRGIVRVDSSNATFHWRNRIVEPMSLRAGSRVEVTGSMRGRTLRATDIVVIRMSNMRYRRYDDRDYRDYPNWRGYP